MRLKGGLGQVDVDQELIRTVRLSIAGCATVEKKMRPGLFDAQLGYQVIGIGADATNGQSTASASSSSSGVLLNLNIGWSF